MDLQQKEQRPQDESPGLESAGPVPAKRPLLLLAVLAIALVVVVGGVVVAQARRNADDEAARAARQAQVERNGMSVMPFDQGRTTHQFTKNATGGVETVTTNDAADAEQAQLVQDHLQHERDLFSAGDFTDPMAIHGHQMPGITELQQGARNGQVTIVYESLPTGARLTYAASTPALVDAVHAWFDAQLMDHGAHATS